MNDVTRTWTRLENWLQENAPELRATMQKGANEQEIQELEQHLGEVLPEDYKAFLKCCNGQSDMAEAGFYNGELLSIANVKFQWGIWHKLLNEGSFENSNSKPDKGIRNNWWNPHWIPFTHNGGGDHLCLDLEPAEGGTVGQVITMWHDSQERELIFPNFTAWLEHVLEGLESGQIVFDRKESNELVNIEDLE
jgi:cell wall assembly regulator SMI1